MNDVRKGQIAFLYLKEVVREKRIQLSPKIRREAGNTAKKLGISTDEAMEFAEIIVRELVDEVFEKKPSKG